MLSTPGLSAAAQELLADFVPGNDFNNGISGIGNELDASLDVFDVPILDEYAEVCQTNFCCRGHGKCCPGHGTLFLWLWLRLGLTNDLHGVWEMAVVAVGIWTCKLAW